MMSMYNMIGLDMIDLDTPTESTLLTKPLLEGATQSVEGFGEVTGIWHGGSSKMGTGDAPEEAMVNFVEWIQQYVECRGESVE